jgi:hypothetical protein
LCVASNIRAMPENEKPPARRVDVYLWAMSQRSGLLKYCQLLIDL